MARVAVILDRLPQDPDWKGAFAWDIVLALAESQHEVLALTTEDTEAIEVSHPRLTIARPAPTFRLPHFPHWLRALLQFQPEVLHTFALKAQSAFSLWPVLAKSVQAFPQIRAYSTGFEEGDYLPFQSVQPPLEFGPVADLQPDFRSEGPATGDLIVPAPVNLWNRPYIGLVMLADFLLNSPGTQAHIIGGWGTMSLSERREGWALLRDLAARVHMTAPLGFPEFVQTVSRSQGLWLRSLKPNAWPAVAAAHVAAPFHIPIWGEVPALRSGSSANFLSRLYSRS